LHRRLSSIAVPVNDANGELIGSLAIIYFASALKSGQAVADFLPGMQKAAENIATDMKET